MQQIFNCLIDKSPGDSYLKSQKKSCENPYNLFYLPVPAFPLRLCTARISLPWQNTGKMEWHGLPFRKGSQLFNDMGDPPGSTFPEPEIP